MLTGQSAKDNYQRLITDESSRSALTKPAQGPASKRWQKNVRMAGGRQRCEMLTLVMAWQLYTQLTELLSPGQDQVKAVKIPAWTENLWGPVFGRRSYWQAADGC